MDALFPYRELADAVLALHFMVVVFIVGGLPVICIGNLAGWMWVNKLWLRSAHLAAIAVVVLQAWLGEYCGLTVLERWLRQEAGESTYSASFVEHWVHQVLYYEAPFWVFGLAYTVFGILVALAWRYFPPTRGGQHERAAGA